MITELFLQLEEKVHHAVETIELLRLQIEELEEENIALKAEHEKWRSDLTALIRRLDQVDLHASASSITSKSHTHEFYAEEESIREPEDFETV